MPFQDFAGRFRQHVYSRLRFNAYSVDTPTVVLPDTGTSIQVIVYDGMAPYFAALRGHRNSESMDTSAPPAIAVDQRFVGRFNNPVYARLGFTGASDLTVTSASSDILMESGSYVLQEDGTSKLILDTPSVAESQTYFVGRFKPPVYTRLGVSASIDGPAPVIQPETQPHFIGRFNQGGYARLNIRHASSEIQVSIAQPDTGISLQVIVYDDMAPYRAAIGRFNAPSIDGPALVLQPEAQPHFTGRFGQSAYARFRYISEDSTPAVGPPQVGQTLTAASGTWTNAPLAYLYQWNRAGTPIGGATASTYVVASADIGSTLTVSVIAINGFGASTQATSVPTGVVIAGGGGALNIGANVDVGLIPIGA